jgi:uncharacterized protein (TIGR00255 family)
MLASMTGFGAGHIADDDRSVQVEIRTVNNRHFKLTVRGSEPYPQLESEFEKLLRPELKRGTVTLHVRVARTASAGSSPLNVAALQSYLNQLAPLAAKLPATAAASLYASVLRLPGIAGPEATGLSAPDDEWPLVERAVREALHGVTAMRRHEGEAMGRELLGLVDGIAARLATIRAELPAATADHRQRLVTRIRQAVADAGVTVDESNLIRETALFADRSDVTEELVRLDGHLAAVRDVVLKGGDGAGRRLEFLAQELGREANTLGSKAGSPAISRQAVEIKATLESIRELGLNIE